MGVHRLEDLLVLGNFGFLRDKKRRVLKVVNLLTSLSLVTRHTHTQYLKEGPRRTAENAAVANLLLVGQALGVGEGPRFLLHSEKGGQVGGVRADDDEGEKVPDGADDARGEGSRN